MNAFTKITSQIDNILSKVKQQNLLLEESRKAINPTFLEIIEDLESSDKTLYCMLLLWYNEKYLNNPVDLDSIIKNIQKHPKPFRTTQDTCGSCGSMRDILGGSC